MYYVGMTEFSSWAITDLSDAGITTALEGVAGRGFNAVTVWAGGGHSATSSMASITCSHSGTDRTCRSSSHSAVAHRMRA